MARRALMHTNAVSCRHDRGFSPPPPFSPSSDIDSSPCFRCLQGALFFPGHIGHSFCKAHDEIEGQDMPVTCPPFLDPAAMSTPVIDLSAPKTPKSAWLAAGLTVCYCPRVTRCSRISIHPFESTDSRFTPGLGDDQTL